MSNAQRYFPTATRTNNQRNRMEWGKMPYAFPFQRPGT
ncbi:hypothetical protein KKH3_19560 [Pectobacterium actinidiae]|nr:hypothetical protein KKH3_19560 [Pectobacterium actinidiae]